MSEHKEGRRREQRQQLSLPMRKSPNAQEEKSSLTRKKSFTYPSARDVLRELDAAMAVDDLGEERETAALLSVGNETKTSSPHASK